MIKKEPEPKIVILACLKSIHHQLENLLKYCIDREEIGIEKYSILIALYNFIYQIMEEFK